MELKEGIIIKTIKYQETSKILYVLTESGVISGLLRNSLSLKSKNYSYSHEGSIILFDLSKSKKNSFDIITSGKCIDRLINIQNDYNKMVNLIEIFSFVYEFYHYIEDNSKFYFLTKTIINKLNDNKITKNNRFYVLIFKLKLLYLLGVGPVFSKCVMCESLKVHTFDILNGGMVCLKDTRKIYYEEEVIKIIEILYLGKLNLFTEEIFDSFKNYLNELEDFVNKYYEAHMPLNKKYENVLNKLK